MRKVTIGAFLFMMAHILSVAWVSPSHAGQTSCTPGITYWSLLESVEVGYVDGRLNIGRLYAQEDATVPGWIKRGPATK